MKRFRPLIFFLVFILALSSLFVNSLAAADSNLVDSNLSNWVDLGDTNSSIYQSVNVSYLGNNTNYITVSGSSKIVALYDLTDFLKIGESYEFSFSLPTIEGLNSAALNSCQLVWFLCDGSNTDFPTSGEQVFTISINNSNKSNFLGKNTTFEFTYTQGFKNTCLCLGILPADNVNSYNYLQLYISNVKLERIVTESEKKLDGILGWLQELWDSIVNGFADLGDSISNLGDSIVDGFNNAIDNLINYLLYFDDEPVENPFETEDNTSSIRDYIADIVDYIRETSNDINNIIQSITGSIYIFDTFVQDNAWLFALCVAALFIVVVSRFIGL